MRTFNPLRSLAALVLAYALIFQAPLALVVFSSQAAQAQWSQHCLQNAPGDPAPAHTISCPCFGLCNAGLADGTLPAVIGVFRALARVDFSLRNIEILAVADFGAQHRPRAPPQA